MNSDILAQQSYGTLRAPASNGRNEPQAPIAGLTAAKRKALVICLAADGTLRKCHGAWKGKDETRISGNTVADLAREGLLTITAAGGHAAAAQLTERGSWFARTAAIAANPAA